MTRLKHNELKESRFKFLVAGVISVWECHCERIR
jgi:hypothetical protein